MERDLQALRRFLEERRRREFVIGRACNDCVAFAFGAVAAQRRTDVAELIGAPSWASLKGALREAKRAGGLEQAVSERLATVAPALAQRGDVAGVADETFGVALMIVEGETLVGPGAGGHVRLKRFAMIRAWSAV